MASRTRSPSTFAAVLVPCAALGACGDLEVRDGAEGPVVLSTIPADGDTSVDTSLPALSVTFSEAMLREGWSWVTEVRHTAPEVTGAAYYVDDVTNVLPVHLQPDTSYVVWVNSPDDEQLRKFASTRGVAAPAYRIRFRTR